MSNIFLNGVSLDELRKQKTLIQRDASKFISDNIASAKELVYSLKHAEDTANFEKIAKQATALLRDVQLVSGVSGVDYLIPYNNEWGDSYSDDDVMTDVLEEVAESFGIEYYGVDSPFDDLHDLLEGMEYDVRQWNSSNC